MSVMVPEGPFFVLHNLDPRDGCKRRRTCTASGKGALHRWLADRGNGASFSLECGMPDQDVLPSCQMGTSELYSVWQLSMVHALCSERRLTLSMSVRT